ncbi:MAG TPA: hypothetical protein VHL77_06170 [Ferruginibacter sp.]|jgi:hypothetical protein|nr:hypothetical protein [Ferruginibacter sp.]
MAERLIHFAVVAGLLIVGCICLGWKPFKKTSKPVPVPGVPLENMAAKSYNVLIKEITNCNDYDKYLFLEKDVLAFIEGYESRISDDILLNFYHALSKELNKTKLRILDENSYV